MDWKLLIYALPVILTVVQIVWMALFWAAGKQFASNRALGIERERVTGALHQIELLKERMLHLPTDDDLSRLKDGIQAVNLSISELKPRVETAIIGVKRIEDHLLERAN